MFPTRVFDELFFFQLYQQLIALSSSLEVPTNYGGQFRVNENQLQLHQSYGSSLSTLPSTSNEAYFQQRQVSFLTVKPTANLDPMKFQQAERQQQLLRMAQQHQRQQIIAANQLKGRPPPRVDNAVIEID